MGLLSGLLTGALQAGVPGPGDDHWYGPVGTITDAGVRIDVETAKKISAWYRGRDILATVLAMLPLPVLEELPNDGGSQAARNHPLYDVLHDKPNVWQDSFQWRRQKMYHLIDHGNGYDRIVAGPRGFVDQLQPIHPTLVTPKQLETGRIVYDIRNPKTNLSTTATQDEIFHLRGASDDGVCGKGILEYARGSLGTASATESYAANIFSQGVLNGGVIENAGVLDPDAGKRMAQSFVTAARQWHMPKVLEQGSTFKPNLMTPEDAQMLLSRKYTVDDIARWLGVPRLMLENSDPSFGNAEQFTQNFIDYFMGPWMVLFEAAVNDQLIIAPRFFALFTRQALVRGNFKDRLEGLALATGGPFMTVDEARKVEDLSTLGGKSGDVREPQNITGKPAPGAAPADPAPFKKKPPADAPAKASAIVLESASRVLRKEIAAVQKLAVRHAADGDAFATAVTDFYAVHVALVEQTLQVSEAEATSYCAGQAAQVVAGDWLVALAQWKTVDYAAGLAALALEDAA